MTTKFEENNAEITKLFKEIKTNLSHLAFKVNVITKEEYVKYLDKVEKDVKAVEKILELNTK